MHLRAYARAAVVLLLSAYACTPAAPPPVAPPPPRVERDSDGDGVADDRDRCPDEAGDADNVEAPGCARRRAEACAGQTRCIRLGESVAFARGSATIAPAEEGALKRIAGWLVSMPEARRVEVRGFARDAAGGKRELILASQRAAHVCTWLVAHGVPEQRLVPRGFSNWPEEEGHLESGVAFEVVEPDQAGCCIGAR